MPQNALNSFRSLLEKAPGWIVGLDTILENATQRQNDLLFANQPADSDKTLVRKPSKSSSVISKPSGDHEHAKALAVEQPHMPGPMPGPNTPVPTLLRPQLPHMTESDALRLSQRKRKTFSACSRDESGPCKYRSRALVVVYFDGDVQKRFTDLVHAVSSCRNDIRRSKLSARIDNLARSGSSGSGRGSGSSVDGETTMSSDTFAYKSTRLQPQGTSGVSRSEALDKVDGLLEKAQTLCEHAAHQVLRDGDCALEVSQTKELLTQARITAELELPGLEKIAAEAEERERQLEEKKRLERSRKPPTPPPAGDSEKIELLAREPSRHPLEVDEIEVDDEDDDSDTELDMAALKLPPNLTKYSMRSTRLTAY